MTSQRCAVVVCFALMAGASRSAEADTGCCVESGACEPCRKVCRLVCEEKKVDILCYGCECEEFCIPGPSRPKCHHCEMVCARCDAEGNCDPDAPHSLAKKFHWTNWLPGHAKLYTRKKLMKKTVSKTIPTFKWAVEDVCCELDPDSQR